ncbi:glycosyltransferase [Adhaeribacter swui]|uniref:Glycosyltransferase n=1 Tax=Adhaeribacter swui TaxID=2086471 RepID=A0A7G7G595_9BACT|nr:glycosyltransferase [Adhaeribacter swui]QNF32329.1 glycosyltransferase [Adhaeribacter swui]
MKIVHVIFSLKTGGAETMLVDVLNEQIKSSSVELIIVNNIYDLTLIKCIDKRVKISFINREPKSLNILKLLKLNYLIFQINPTVIHCHNHNLAPLIKFTGTSKICLTVHSLNMPLKHFTKYNQVFAISDAVRKDILSRSGINVKVVYNGIDFEKVEYKENINSYSPLFSILQVSRLDYKLKGQDVLLRALAILIHDKGIKYIKLDLIGESNNNSDKIYLENLVHELDIKDYVNFLGLKRRDYVYLNLKSYSLLVQPSIYEGFGLTIVEAIAAKIPVLVSDIEGPMEVIGGGKFGEYFEKANHYDCASKIEKLIMDYSNQHRLDKINRSFEFAFNTFNIKNTANNYLKEYALL